MPFFLRAEQGLSTVFSFSFHDSGVGGGRLLSWRGFFLLADGWLILFRHNIVLGCGLRKRGRVSRGLSAAVAETLPLRWGAPLFLDTLQIAECSPNPRIKKKIIW